MKALHSDFDAKERIQMFFNEIIEEFEKVGITKPKSYLAAFNREDYKIRLLVKPFSPSSGLDFKVITFDIDFIIPIYEKWSLQDDCGVREIDAIIAHWKERNFADQKENLERKISSLQSNVAHHNEQIEKTQNEIEENLIKLETLKVREQTIIN